jgi:hypothetical protein
VKHRETPQPSSQNKSQLSVTYEAKISIVRRKFLWKPTRMLLSANVYRNSNLAYDLTQKTVLHLQVKFAPIQAYVTGRLRLRDANEKVCSGVFLDPTAVGLGMMKLFQRDLITSTDARMDANSCNPVASLLAMKLKS